MQILPLHYEIKPIDPHAHVFTAVCQIEKSQDHQEIFLPNWIPGSYKIRDFCKHVISIHATANGQRVELTQIAKNRWRVESPSAKLMITAKIYAWDSSVRGCHLDQTHGFFNGTHCFFTVKGFESQPCSVEFSPPEGDAYKQWRLATAMSPLKAEQNGFGFYQAQHYDELIDHPFEMGIFELVSYEVNTVPHRMAITGQVRLDVKKLTSDLTKLCTAHINMFGEHPSSHYIFLTRVLPKAFNGLEHRASSALVISRKNMPYPDMPDDTEDYATFLSLVSHEYFHAWNVKRIKPEAFMPYHLDQESYTRQLWIFEGFTSYYEDLALVRAGLISIDLFFKMFAEKMTSVLNGPGHLVQPVTDSSFCAWDKFYDPNENTPNAVVSYYTKGAVIALLIDAYLREHTSFTLDDLMRTLWQQFGKPNKGVPEGWVEKHLGEMTEQGISASLNEWLYEAKPLPIEKAAESLGVNFAYLPKSSDTSVELGVKLDSNNVITVCYSDSCAMLAGLSAQDKLLAINGLSVDVDKIDTLLRPYQVGDTVLVHAFRGDQLMTFNVMLQPKRPSEVKLTLADCDETVLTRRHAWLSC